MKHSRRKERKDSQDNQIQSHMQRKDEILLSNIQRRSRSDSIVADMDPMKQVTKIVNPIDWAVKEWNLKKENLHTSSNIV